ncbi:MAG: hypothetical protein HY701_05700 [Gemmatimonadetes bacterium]|nr:hypothetical protein [Gemmatimonadota bacterium]
MRGNFFMGQVYVRLLMECNAAVPGPPRRGAQGPPPTSIFRGLPPTSPIRRLKNGRMLLSPPSVALPKSKKQVTVVDAQPPQGAAHQLGRAADRIRRPSPSRRIWSQGVRAPVPV